MMIRSTPAMSSPRAAISDAMSTRASPLRKRSRAACRASLSRAPCRSATGRLRTVDHREPERFEDADYRVLEQIPFCTNGKGFTAQSRHTLSWAWS